MCSQNGYTELINDVKQTIQTNRIVVILSGSIINHPSFPLVPRTPDLLLYPYLSTLWGLHPVTLTGRLSSDEDHQK